MSEIEIREAALSLDAVEERTITGLAVPYNQRLLSVAVFRALRAGRY